MKALNTVNGISDELSPTVPLTLQQQQQQQLDSSWFSSEDLKIDSHIIESVGVGVGVGSINDKTVGSSNGDKSDKNDKKSVSNDTSKRKNSTGGSSSSTGSGSGSGSGSNSNSTTIIRPQYRNIEIEKVINSITNKLEIDCVGLLRTGEEAVRKAETRTIV